MTSSPDTPSGQPSAENRTLSRSILALEPVWVLLLSPFLLLPGKFIPAAWQPWVVAAVFLFWPLRWWLQGSITIRTPVRLAALLFLLCIPLAMLVTTDATRSWEALSYLALGVVLANAAVNMPLLQRSPEMLAWLLILMGIGLGLIGPLVISESTIGAPLFARLQNATGSITSLLGETINPNILSHALLAILPLAAAFALRMDSTKQKWLRWFSVGAALLMTATIILTDSRGALLALAAIFPLLLVLRFPKLLWAAPIVLIGIAAALLLGGAGLLDALTQASNGSATSGFAERVELWQRGLYAIQDFPFTGIGMGTYGTVIPFLYPFLIVPPNTFLPDAHNLPIQVGVDMGIPGLVTWLAMVFCLLVMMSTILRRTQDAICWALATGVLTSIVGMLVSGIFAATNWGVKPAFLPWLIGAIGVLVFRQHWLKEERTVQVSVDDATQDAGNNLNTDGASTG